MLKIMNLLNKNLSILSILFKSNNILCTLTDTKGNTLIWATAGSKKIRSTKKITSISITNMIKTLYDYSYKTNSTEIYIKIKGANKNKNFLIKKLKTIGFTIWLIQESLILPHNGCRKIRSRRI
uniref:Ribosomal protein S11 n=1 Tax=Calliarthron tuberculosum TaxID=48942 RepID=A0A0F7C9W4_CALTB|nr:ribosomal protein S11 [Calliarthron tuberculosum]AKG26266.1 ribosomal protein S11 [Calliarthron tuberculosum]